jgi:hypothetical protein
MLSTSEFESKVDDTINKVSKHVLLVESVGLVRLNTESNEDTFTNCNFSLLRNCSRRGHKNLIRGRYFRLHMYSS